MQFLGIWAHEPWQTMITVEVTPDGTLTMAAQNPSSPNSSYMPGATATENRPALVVATLAVGRMPGGSPLHGKSGDPTGEAQLAATLTTPPVGWIKAPLDATANTSTRARPAGDIAPVPERSSNTPEIVPVGGGSNGIKEGPRGLGRGA
jgi:hypothetical protein